MNWSIHVRFNDGRNGKIQAETPYVDCSLKPLKNISVISNLQSDQRLT